MSLLEVITKASSNIPTLAEKETTYPIVFNPEPIFLKLKSEIHDLKDENPVKKVTGWEISQTDSDLINLGVKLFKNLKKQLKGSQTFGRDDFLKILSSHLEKIGDKLGLGEMDEGDVCKLVEKLGFAMCRDVKELVLEGCISLEVWDVLESLITNGIVEHHCISNLIFNLIEKRKSDLIVLCVKYLFDLKTYDLMCILKYFLDVPSDGYKSLVRVREDWENQALLAIEKVSNKGLSAKEKSLAKDASLLVMLAHDDFSVSELCLHYLLASKNLDDVIFSACVGKLNGEEITALIQYLSKWLRKYERFPQVRPCPKASSVLGLKVCDWIPTLENVVKCLGLVVDEHFSSLVMRSELHEDWKALEGVVNSLAAEGRLCGTLANLTERLKSELNVREERWMLN